MAGSSEALSGKISSEFAVRLLRLQPGQHIRAMLVLRPRSPVTVSGGRQSRTERQAAIYAFEKSMESCLAEVDRILGRHHGRRLAPKADALGSVPVEATVSGISALAASDCVKVILEDQPVVRMHSKSR